MTMKLAIMAMACPLLLSSTGSSYEFTEPGVIQGIVIEELTRRPVIRAQVRIPGTNYQTYTDSLGHYRLDGLQGREFTVQARAIGYIAETRQSRLPFPPHTVCGGVCRPWVPSEVLNFYMRRVPVWDS